MSSMKQQHSLHQLLKKKPGEISQCSLCIDHIHLNMFRPEQQRNQMLPELSSSLSNNRIRNNQIPVRDSFLAMDSQPGTDFISENNDFN